jgi:chemotaxis protein MotA
MRPSGARCEAPEHMFVIIGYVLVIVAVFGGYAIAGGSFGVIIKAAPIELFIIGGSALGAFLVANSGKTIKATMKALPLLMKGSKYTKARYMELMALLYEILAKARKEGLMSIENDVENPHDSALFKKFPNIAADHHLVEFITDYLRMMLSGNMNAHEIENLMDGEIETHHQEAHTPVNAIQNVGDGLPAFGIVAAVLGVVKTMASVGQPPAVLGQMIAGALVGTFLGILLAYGFVSPLAKLLEQKAEEGHKELQCVKITLLASLQGYAPAIAVEFGRKVLFSTERPSFQELEAHVKQKKA